MRPEALSWPTRGSRFVGLLFRPMTRRFSSPPPAAPSFFSPPPQATRSASATGIHRRVFIVFTPRMASVTRGMPLTVSCPRMLFRRLAFLAVITVAVAVHAQQKVIVLGFDGVDARYTEKWMNEGKLPNLAKLRAAGTFRPLRPTLPAQTPVSWSTFSTGIDPGRTGIFDFLRRDPKTYLPLFAAFDEVTEPFLLGEK